MHMELSCPLLLHSGGSSLAKRRRDINPNRVPIRHLHLLAQTRDISEADMLKGRHIT